MGDLNAKIGNQRMGEGGGTNGEPNINRNWRGGGRTEKLLLL